MDRSRPDAEDTVMTQGMSMLKLPGHTRYDYVPITKRAHYSWPGGKRLAFYVGIAAALPTAA